MIDEHKLLFYRNISHSKNVILKILMCLTGVLSDYCFCVANMMLAVLPVKKWYKRCSDAHISRRGQNEEGCQSCSGTSGATITQFI